MQEFLMVKKLTANNHMSRQVLRSQYGPHADILEEKTLLVSSFSSIEVDLHIFYKDTLINKCLVFLHKTGSAGGQVKARLSSYFFSLPFFLGSYKDMGCLGFLCVRMLRTTTIWLFCSKLISGYLNFTFLAFHHSSVKLFLSKNKGQRPGIINAQIYTPLTISFFQNQCN